jgi:Na+:H+ antiporter, NhaA family
MAATSRRFLRIEASSGLLLLIMAAVALVWANSPWGEGYAHFWHTPIGIRLGSFAFERSLAWFVNDCLMVVFFFVVGMEIRREVHHGELSEWRRALVPVAAALGGMLAPAALYLLIAGASPTRSGWGVPMATDIAFAVGVLALLGKRVPPALRVLLLALAVIDDLGAIVVVALFYSSGVALLGFFIAALGLVGILGMQRFDIRSRLAYIVPAVVVWAGIYSAGVHPTIAGVIVGLVTPVQLRPGPSFRVAVLADLEMSPSASLIEMLHPWVAFLIMPVFALANAGVTISSGDIDAVSGSVLLGVSTGLVVGKPVGILLAIGATVALKIGKLPVGIKLGHLVVLGLVAGIGFTMALFVSQLAFADAKLLSAAKLGILMASSIAAVIGLVVGRLFLVPRLDPGAAQSVDEAEQSTDR